jgi:serine/threonine protein kinase
MNAEHKITETGLVVGTLAYISPEQIEHNIADARSDVYSLGITLYEMVTGRIPFDGDRQAVLLGHLRRIPAAPIEVNPKVPLPISAAIMKAISKDPEKRFQTAAEFRAELSSDPTSRITPLMGRRRLVAAIGVAGTAAGFATWRIAQTPNVSVPAHKVQPQSNDLQPKTDALPGPGGIAEGTGSAIPAPIPEADHTPRKSIAKIQKSEPQQPPKDLVDELERAQKRLNVADSRLAWLIAKQKELGLAPGDRMTSDLDTAKRSLEKVGQLLRAGRLTEAREQLRRGEMLVRRFENELGR